MAERRPRHRTSRILAALLGPAVTGVFTGTVGWAVAHDPKDAATSVEVQPPTSSPTPVTATAEHQLERLQQQLSDTRARLRAMRSTVAQLGGTIDDSPTPGRASPAPTHDAASKAASRQQTTTSKSPTRQQAVAPTNDPTPTKEPAPPPPTHTKTGASGGG